MDYKPKKEHRLDRGGDTCFCKRKFKDGEDPIYNMKKIGKKLKQKKDGKNYRKYPAPAKIIDFDFKPGQKVKMGAKEKKPPTSGKIKMKTYGNMDWQTKL
tara:strand:- start:8452 stop:8751 length:300 start_codon:yes stop_codon:yes gene_type:complete